jgi:hypothetical protein
MNTRVILATACIAAVSLLAVSAVGAPEPMKRHTFPAGVDRTILWHGKLTVLLPAGWKVRTSSPSATDPVHTSVTWTVGTWPQPKGSTLADIREWWRSYVHGPLSRHGWRDAWGWENGRWRIVGDNYLTLPMGKVWRLTTLTVPSKKAGGWAARSYRRIYYTRRGLTTDAATGGAKELFISFWITCSPADCPAHNAQLNTIMRSIRFLPSRS